MSPRPVCGMFPAYPSDDAATRAESRAESAGHEGTTLPGLQPPRLERDRRALQNVVYVEGSSPRRSAHPVRQIPIFPFAAAASSSAVARSKTPTPSRALLRSTGGRRAASPLRWTEEPLTVGLALLFAPPIGVALLWSSPRFSYEARLAVTVFIGFVFALAALVLVAR